MAKKNSAEQALSVGTKVRVRAGVAAPEFPEVSCAGWTGEIAELTGKKADPKFLIEWDDETLRRMPPDYVRQCEQKQLFYRMACFGPDEVEPLDG